MDYVFIHCVLFIKEIIFQNPANFLIDGSFVCVVRILCFWTGFIFHLTDYNAGKQNRMYCLE